MSRGLRTDGLGTVIGGLFNTFPYTSFSQNVGLVGVTGVKSRYVCVAGGIIMLIMGLVPKLGALVESVPLFVLGGAGIVMFGMVAATGIRILSDVDYKTSRNNLYVVAISIGFGMIPLVAPTFFDKLPKELEPDPALGHPAHRHLRRRAQPLLQRHRQPGRGAGGGQAHDARQRMNHAGR